MLVTVLGGQAPMPHIAPALHRVLTVTFGGSVAARGCLQLDVLGARQDLFDVDKLDTDPFCCVSALHDLRNVVSRGVLSLALAKHIFEAFCSLPQCLPR